ncbi:endocuticle structural protein SgAbd-6-like [Eupeodes corollae]|uniref:endocuticle structural protein SgAbd-6-like n=1 Tax=Eupeodes corollae TaxID=290404 RepID=UPI002490EC6B|nr:endocuticle structural protein SgAbd-6-like [Eupeodes corollae]
MNSVIFIVLALFAINILAAPLDDSKIAQIISYENENLGIDGYKFSFETSDGTKRSEEATLKNIGKDNEAISVRGTISWLGADGITYTINFLADENGYQPEGDHIPKA